MLPTPTPTPTPTTCHDQPLVSITPATALVAPSTHSPSTMIVNRP